MDVAIFRVAQRPLALQQYRHRLETGCTHVPLPDYDDVKVHNCSCTCSAHNPCSMIAVTRQFQCLDIKSHLHRTFWSFCQSYRCLQKMGETSPSSLLACTEPSRDEVIARLQEVDTTDMLAKLPPPPASSTRAAVLLPLFYRNSRLHVLLTVRSTKLKSHQGDVAFPGGKWDEGDADVRATALREAEEEVGLPRDKVRVISQLETSTSYRGTLIVPVVGFIPEDFRPVPNPAEVQDVFSVPLSKFLRSEDHFQREWKDGTNRYTINYFRHSEGGKTFTTYGLTASICILAASVCFASRPEFESNILYDSTNPKKYLRLAHDKYMRQVKDLQEKELQGKL